MYNFGFDLRDSKLLYNKGGFFLILFIFFVMYDLYKKKVFIYIKYKNNFIVWNYNV